jgi:phosphoglycolate phosphatase-like HAD superfamily hydrolase
MRPTLVLFDIDGTLIDTGGAGRIGLQESFRAVFGVDDIEGPVSRVRFAGKTDPTIIADIAREAGIPPGDVEARYRELKDVLPGVRMLLDALKARSDVFLGLVTGNIEEGARIKLEAFGLSGHFMDGGFASDHPERGEIARIAHERLSRRAGFRFPADRVMVIGDTEFDISCARANSFRAIAVESGYVTREQLEAAGPDTLLADLTDTAAVLAAMGL